MAAIVEATSAADVSDVVRHVTKAEVEFFRENGWAKLPGLVSPVAAHAMLERARTYMSTGGDGAGEGKTKDIGWWTEWRYMASREGEPAFTPVVLSKNMGMNAQRLLGRDKPILCWHDIVACKMPVTGESASGKTLFHQDGPNWPLDRAGVGMWLALDDIEPHQGAVRYFSGSHREGPLGRVPRWRDADGQIRGQDEEYPHLRDTYELSLPFTLKAGDALCHHNLTVHGAGVNAGDRPRWAVIIHYVPNDSLYTGAPNADSDDLDLRLGFPVEDKRVPQVYP